MELAAKQNKEPLPLISERFGLSLPPERHCLSAPTYQIDTSLVTRDAAKPGQSSSAAPVPSVGAEPVLTAPVELSKSASKRKRSDESDDSDDYDEV